ncbi:hypothetical protein BS47DRAFT_1327335 [Hydnum rufescens UP504]|uniref:Uncharacterized protein n=1 Tax=Hydnum rufescens UP504 TaxID=1448309 RepID=A0A9P6DZ74_9AGAM|nr:hypothetical protein BS47DRAFT_1327335 [Hydnum rufescens UP504]
MYLQGALHQQPLDFLGLWSLPYVPHFLNPAVAPQQLGLQLSSGPQGFGTYLIHGIDFRHCYFIWRLVEVWSSEIGSTYFFGPLILCLGSSPIRRAVNICVANRSGSWVKIYNKVCRSPNLLCLSSLASNARPSNQVICTITENKRGILSYSRHFPHPGF